MLMSSFVATCLQIERQFVMVDEFEHQALAAADDSRRNLMFFGCRQNENHIGRRFFDGFQKSVEALLL